MNYFKLLLLFFQAVLYFVVTVIICLNYGNTNNVQDISYSKTKKYSSKFDPPKKVILEIQQKSFRQLLIKLYIPVCSFHFHDVIICITIEANNTGLLQTDSLQFKWKETTQW